MFNLRFLPNFRRRITEAMQSTSLEFNPTQSTLDYEFLPPFVEDTDNGLCFKDIYVPEEVLTLILSHVPAKQLLRLSLVCKKWCRIIRSHALWALVYERHYKKVAKRLPWYVFYCRFSTEYFDRNLLKNGNGQEEYKHWKIIKSYGDGFRIEAEPVGAKPLPEDVPEFNGHRCCFATSYYECNKLQEIYLGRSRLVQYVINKYTPTIIASEWATGRFDCGCVYRLICRLMNKERNFNLHEDSVQHRIEQWSDPEWTKIQVELSEYPFDENYPYEVNSIVFQHEGNDTQFWKGHYGSKMAGGVVKIVFDSIGPLKTMNL